MNMPIPVVFFSAATKAAGRENAVAKAQQDRCVFRDRA
jgi:hypothetical protein